ncbi:hypothetical protein EB118_19565 [bacterium]|jgi:hypothetical protein|nr:hypothetical protein [bacterium]
MKQVMIAAVLGTIVLTSCTGGSTSTEATCDTCKTVVAADSTKAVDSTKKVDTTKVVDSVKASK